MSAMASRFNSAVARTGGLIATALLGSVLASKGDERSPSSTGRCSHRRAWRRSLRSSR